MEKFDVSVDKYKKLWYKVAEAYAKHLYEVQTVADKDLCYDSYCWFVDDILCKDLVRRPDELIASAEKYVDERFKGKEICQSVAADGRLITYPKGERELFTGAFK